MSVSIASINNAVHLALGSPDKSICDLIDVHYATRAVVTLLTSQSRGSDNNQLLSKTNEFTPTSSLHNITALISGTEAWLEIKDGEVWRKIRVVNKSDLESYYSRGLQAAAFYGDETGARFVEFSFDPIGASTFRIWFDKDAVPVALANNILIPDRFAPYIEILSANHTIVKIKLRLAQAIESEENRKLLQVQLDAWDGLYAHNALQIPDWKKEFRNWKNRSRSSQGATRLPAKSGKKLYG